jgi:hypothetical protein
LTLSAPSDYNRGGCPRADLTRAGIVFNPMKPTLCLIFALSWALAPLAAQAQSLGPYEPPTGCYIGAYIELDRRVKDDIAAFEALTNKQHASYFRYVGYGQPFPFEWAGRLKAVGAMPHIAWEPNDGLEAIADDAYLRGFAQACAHFAAPIFLRFASEMNGDWEAYSGDPALYVRKWRLVYDVIHAVAPNVIMCWCPFATPKSTIPLYYPGDEYVDWVGVNLYSVVCNDGNPQKRTTDNAVQDLEFIYNLYADRKPIAICEYAATHYCGALKSQTVDFAIREMRRLYGALCTRFPRVRMINWFSVDTVEEGLAYNNYSLTDNEQILATYRELIASPHFLSRVVAPTVALVTPGAGVALPAMAGAPGQPLGVAPRPSSSMPSIAAPFPPAPTPSPAAGPAQPEPRPAAPPAALPRTSVPLAFADNAAPAPNSLAIVVRGGSPNALFGRVFVEAIPGSALQPDRIIIELDGIVRCSANAAPYSFPWNADRAAPGEHIIHAVAKGRAGEILAEAQAAVVVTPPR